MSILNTNSRTVKSSDSEKFQPLGRTTALHGAFIGFVKRVDDVQKMGRLQVWIPEFGSEPEREDGWVTVSYCAPFAGGTNVETTSTGNIKQFEGTQTSYGMWMVPPDINNQVVVIFINGDPSRGVWIGSMYQQFMNNMVPAMAASANNYQYQGKNIPIAEYNKWDIKVTQPDQAAHPYESTKFKGLGNQGLITDPQRGITDSSARRESPSSVFGILTPGPAIDSKVPYDKIRRKGGHSITLDDQTGNEYIQLATKSGAQIKIDESNGFVYLINRDGTGWVQIDQKGNIDVFGAGDISARAQRDINFRADRNVNIEAGQNVYIKAAKDTNQTTSNFTYDVNNIPSSKSIPFWQYVGAGNGQGGNVVIQSLNDIHTTVGNNNFLTVKNNMNVNITNALNLSTTSGGQNYKSAQAIKITTSNTFDLLVSNNLTVSSGSNIAISGASNILAQAGGTMGLTASSILGTSSTVGFTGSLSVHGGSSLAGPVNLGGSVSVPSAPIPAAAASAASAASAEIKPTNDKINILPDWQDKDSKFKRNSAAIQTTITRFPTYEPCPEHEKFTYKSIYGYKPKFNDGDNTYDGSGAPGNGNTSSTTIPTNTTPGAANTVIQSDSPLDSSVTKDFNMAAFECQIKIHEGVRYKSYNDSLGLPTGGIGHLLRVDEIPQYPVPTTIPDDVVANWFANDSTSAIKGAQELLGIDVWGDLTDPRKRACADLCYNLGKTKLAKFVRFLAAMKSGDYNAAGQSLRDSKWFGQVGSRGPKIVSMIVQSVDPNGCDKKFPTS